MPKGGLYVNHESLVRDEAVTRLVAAAAALRLPDTNNIAIALAETGMALLCLVKLDKDERARELLVKALRSVHRVEQDEEKSDEGHSHEADVGDHAHADRGRGELGRTPRS